MKKYYVLFLLLFVCMIGKVYAEDTYTCSARNVSKMYCNIIKGKEEIIQQKGCTITENSDGCSGTCTNLTEKDINDVGKILNISIEDCTKNEPVPTDKGETPSEPAPDPTPTDKGSNPTPTPAPVTTTGNNNTSNNPQTGVLMVTLVWVVGMCSFIFMCTVFFKHNRVNGG